MCLHLQPSPVPMVHTHWHFLRSLSGSINRSTSYATFPFCSALNYRTLRVKRRCITEGAMVILGHFFGQKYLEGAFTSEGAPNQQKERRKKNNSEAPNLEQVGLGQLKC